MGDFFTLAQRQLQGEFETTDLADRIVEAVVTEELSDPQAEFIHSRNMFYLSTIDESGYPSCSYKGGDLGFVRVINPVTIVFPNYDGNGMFMSMGNIQDKAKVGLLFIDFETPQRLRLRGEARCLREGPMLDSYPGANLVVEISVNHVWVNCPRYVHRMQPLEQSPYLPGKDGAVSLALWKRVDLIQDVLTAEDRAEAESLGLITLEEYEAYVARGKLL
ncbi:MAG: pyridoxamine 5'-phosphate oxidase family protein [Pseudomonadota bacterium]|nr:pyridoxamine 5'-phosphate oxidase family protein [Pseudomonadota bacterium]MEC9300147.1 pyridoxamine 5'-phosphate oxidase family protein [Pseudomonadota bacterium]MEE3239051.1 pyridoxamine 5'-phosphate oxidase family protein [Pseudomonadota bacterium]HAI15795.1 pyridoxamine 5'-phosphate oxidase [Gammaproteobacteria bacterium]|tara:strand:- start:1160 stop:1816 length:657 start_codon:yes stop_codon:yes gene_type:complete